MDGNCNMKKSYHIYSLYLGIFSSQNRILKMQITLQDAFLRQLTTFIEYFNFIFLVQNQKKNSRNAFPWQFFKMLNIALTYDLAFPPPRYVSKRTENMSTQKLVHECSRQHNSE